MPDDLSPPAADARHTVSEERDLRERFREPSERVQKKAIPRLDRHCREIIRRSPFLCLATANGAGQADVSPRGDPPGFVTVLDDNTLLIPDRPGNNRLDSMANILANPEVGLIFFIPGWDETLRVNGTAEIIDDPAVLQGMALEGHTPKVAIRVHVREAMLHCAKAIRRSRLWDPAAHMPKGALPGVGKMVMDMANLDGDPDAADASYEKAVSKLYE